MQHTMLGWIEAADARTAVQQATIILVPRKSGIVAVSRMAHLATLLGMMLAVFGR